MKLKVLGSGSKGNSYILEGENETLLLEAGISYKEILKGLDFKLDKVVGCLITHEHKDHSRAIKDLTKNGIDIYTSGGTLHVLQFFNHRCHVISNQVQFKIGEFTILPFKTQHDCIEPLGFLIYHAEIGKLIFITDSYFCKYKFNNVNNVMIECNYSQDILDRNIKQGFLPEVLAKRLMKSHFSLDHVKEFLGNININKCRNVILLHLSEGNSDARKFKTEIEKLTGLPTYIADKNLEIDL